MFESILRLFRRPARSAKSGLELATETQAIIDQKARLDKASRTMPLRTTSAEQPASSRFPCPGATESGAGLTPDLELLLANGRAAAERLAQAMEPTAERAKPKPTKFTARCGWCLEPFDREPRSPGELEKLRQVLFFTGPQAVGHIDICDPCYDNVVGSAARLNNSSSLDVGQSNSGPSNMLLRTFGKPAA